MTGKGDTPRPLSVPTQTFAERWAATFGNKTEQELPDDDTILRAIGVPNANGPLRVAVPYRTYSNLWDQVFAEYAREPLTSTEKSVDSDTLPNMAAGGDPILPRVHSDSPSTEHPDGEKLR